MRMPHVAAVASLLLAACSAETVAPPPPAPVDWHSFDARRAAPPKPPSPDERPLAESYLAAIAAPDLAPLKPLLDDTTHCSFPGRDDVRGADQVLRAHEVVFGPLDARSVAATRIWRMGTVQAVEWTMTATHARPWLGLAPTDKPIAVRGLALLWAQQDGQLADIHVYFDAVAAKASLGIGPKALRGLVPPPLPTGAPKVYARSSTDEPAKNVAPVRAALDALEENKESVFLASMSDGVEIHTLQLDRPMRGKEEARAYFRNMRKGIAQLDTTIVGAWGVDSFAVVEYTFSGEQIGPIGWIPFVRDRVVRVEAVDVVEVRDGHIASIWRFDDLGELAVPPAGASR